MDSVGSLLRAARGRAFLGCGDMFSGQPSFLTNIFALSRLPRNQNIKARFLEIMAYLTLMFAGVYHDHLFLEIQVELHVSADAARVWPASPLQISALESADTRTFSKHSTRC